MFEVVFAIVFAVAILFCGIMAMRADMAVSESREQYRARMDALADRMDDVIDKLRALRNPKG